MFDFFKKKKPIENKPQQHIAPGTQIHYMPELIKNLENDHKELLKIFGDIKANYDAKKYVKVTKKLKLFRAALTDHLLIENIQLYIYLSHQLAGDEMVSELVKEFKREMNQISKVVMKFLTRYKTIGVDEDLAETFGKDLNEIGEALIERIKREEHTLYPLYMPNY